MRINKGKKTKKIFITHKGEETTVSEYLKEKCPDLYTEGMFTLQKETGCLKLAGKVAVIKSEQGFQYNYASSSCVATNGRENFILTVKHWIDNTTGPLDKGPNMCLSTSEIESSECPRMLGYYGARNGHLIDVLLIQLPFSVSPVTQLSVTPVPEPDVIVRKYGVSTGYTDGIIMDKSYSHRISDDIGICYDFFLVAANQRSGRDKFADQGDSGALVKLGNDPTQAIGMVFAVQENFQLSDECVLPHVTVCIPLDAQLDQIRELWQKNLSLYEGDIRSTLYVL